MPLIYFEVVEWHRTNRVMSHLDLRKHVRHPCGTTRTLHNELASRAIHFDWSLFHDRLLPSGNYRSSVVVKTPNIGAKKEDHPDMLCYRSITSRFVTHPGMKLLA